MTLVAMAMYVWLQCACHYGPLSLKCHIRVYWVILGLEIGVSVAFTLVVDVTSAAAAANRTTVNANVHM